MISHLTANHIGHLRNVKTEQKCLVPLILIFVEWFLIVFTETSDFTSIDGEKNTNVKKFYGTIAIL